MPAKSLMLAKTGDPKDLAKYEKSGHKLLEEKFDGERIQVLSEEEDNYYVRAFGRSKKEFTTQVPEIMAEFFSKISEEYHFDGEIIHQNEFLTLEENFSTCSSRMRLKAPTKQQVDDSPLTYVIFDVLVWEGKDVTSLSLYERRLLIQSILISKRIDPEVAFLSPAYYDKFQERYEKYLEDGKEGVMIKDMDSPYVGARSSHWEKIIPALTLDVKTIGLTPGKGKNQKYFGAFACETEKGVHFNSGPGNLTQEEMGTIKRDIEKGALTFPFMIEVSYKGIMPSGKPRQPRTKRLRPDKEVYQTVKEVSQKSLFDF
jgi:ATP-dependent DNA ligase